MANAFASSFVGNSLIYPQSSLYFVAFLWRSVNLFVIKILVQSNSTVRKFQGKLALTKTYHVCGSTLFYLSILNIIFYFLHFMWTGPFISLKFVSFYFSIFNNKPPLLNNFLIIKDHFFWWGASDLIYWALVGSEKSKFLRSLSLYEI